MPRNSRKPSDVEVIALSDALSPTRGLDGCSSVSEDQAPTNDEWIPLLSAEGPMREVTVSHLHRLLVKAASHQVHRMPDAVALGHARREEVIHAAADEATISVLSRLDSFEGRSKFTTWAFKFGILHAGVELRRAVWRDREIQLHDLTDPVQPEHTSPEAHVEGGDLAQAVRAGMEEALTEHQRRVATALLIDEVPIDVLADRLGTNRGALYKTLHDARKRLRAHLTNQGFMPAMTAKEAIS